MNKALEPMGGTAYRMRSYGLLEGAVSTPTPL